MRTEVYLLTRNVLIQGDNLNNWGCQIVTSSMTDGLSIVRNG